MTDKKKNGSKQEPSTFEENVKAAYGTKPRDPKTIGSNIKLKGGKEPTETEKLTLVSSYRSPSMSSFSIHVLTFPLQHYVSRLPQLTNVTPFPHLTLIIFPYSHPDFLFSYLSRLFLSLMFIGFSMESPLCPLFFTF